MRLTEKVARRTVNGCRVVNFHKNCQGLLAQPPTAIFSLRMQNLGKDPHSLRNRRAYADQYASCSKPMAEAFFAGKIDLARLSFFEPFATKLGKQSEGMQVNDSALVSLKSCLHEVTVWCCDFQPPSIS